MTVHPRNNSTNRYSLFNEIFGDTTNSTVLDFGGSSGNLLYFSHNKIKQENYTCIDIVKEAIESGNEEFSQATFIHNNRYNWMYNHLGNDNLIFPDINKKQDYIWAYSVFSHTDLNEFIETVKWLMTFDYKKIAVSFLTFNEMLEWAYNKRLNEYGKCIDIRNSNFQTMYFFDNDKIITDDITLTTSKNYKYLLTFYNIEYLTEFFQQHNIHINITYPGDGYVPFLIVERT